MTPISSPRPHRPASGQALRKARRARLVRVAAGAAGLCLLLALGFGHLALAAAGRAATQPAGPRTVPVRLTEWFDDLRLSLVAVEDRPDNPAGSTTYVIKDVFTTRNGEWTVSGDPYTVPDWAITTYLTPDFQKAYERNNLYGAVLDRNGNFIPGQGILYWTGGIEKLTDLGSTVHAVIQANETPGWATMVLFGSSSYDPASGQSGPWCWTPSGLRAEVLCGGGLPNGLAVSTFVVWQEVDDPGTATPTVTPSPTFTTTPEVTPSPTVTTTPEVTVTPTMTTTPEVTATPTLTPTPVPTIVRRVGTWVDDMNLRVRTLAERPDEIAQSDVTYLIKDIFTTRDGQWEPSSIFGSVDQWARDAYLKPADDPEYFDDAGADRHLFAAIFGLDGKLQKNADLLYWSDGFEMLGDPNYDGYVMGVDGARYPRTKDRSGWGNMFMSTGSSYVPERGEMGPWCWVPRGLAAEVMCGGGMPANNHISTFVVWQAVQGTILQPMPEGDFFVYMPAISDE